MELSCAELDRRRETTTSADDGDKDLDADGRGPEPGADSAYVPRARVAL